MDDPQKINFCIELDSIRSVPEQPSACFQPRCGIWQLQRTLSRLLAETWPIEWLSRCKLSDIRWLSDRVCRCGLFFRPLRSSWSRPRLRGMTGSKACRGLWNQTWHIRLGLVVTESIQTAMECNDTFSRSAYQNSKQKKWWNEESDIKCHWYHIWKLTFSSNGHSEVLSWAILSACGTANEQPAWIS